MPIPPPSPPRPYITHSRSQSSPNASTFLPSTLDAGRATMSTKTSAAAYQTPTKSSKNRFVFDDDGEMSTVETPEVSRSAPGVINQTPSASSESNPPRAVHMTSTVNLTPTRSSTPRVSDTPPLQRLVISPLALDPLQSHSLPASTDQAPQDQSFMRWSKTASTIFSEAPSSHFYFNKRSTGYNDIGGSPPGATRPKQIEEEQSLIREEGKRTSNGTFGNRPRRCSAVGSSSNGSILEDPFLDEVEQQAAATPDETQEGNSSSIGSNRPKLRRHLSMSSASDSTFSVPTMETRAAHTGTSGHFPSPTHRRPSHKAPETAQAIDAHLLKSSAKSESKIVPRGRPLPPPSSGTPLKGGVKEESLHGDSSESDFGSKLHKRTGSKLEKMLGEGAETARVLMEFERRAIKEVVEMPSTGGPKPPARGHKHSASMSSATGFTPPSTPQHDVGRVQFAPHRSTSVDSLPSLHPSLSDSITTLSRLLPTSPPPFKPLPSVPTHTTAALRTHPELSAAQRAMLVRRARKLESILGETLPETQVEKHIIDPIHSSTTVLTKVSNDWPSTPKNTPEYDREDVVPRTVRNLTVAPATIGKGSRRLADRARTALRLGAKDEETDLRVYVEREIRVQETGIRGTIVRPGMNRAPWSNPTSPTGVYSPAESIDVTEADDQKTRRKQLAKRLLGVPISPSLVPPRQTDQQGRAIAAQPSRLDLSPIAQRSSEQSSLSFISFDEGESPPSKWKTKLKQSLVLDKKVSKTESFIDLRDSKHTTQLSSRASISPIADRQMTDKEKSAARKRAAKLEHVFGDAPPQELYLNSRSSSNDSSDGVLKSFDSYEKSLQSLIYLVDNDRNQLVDIVDSLNDRSPISSSLDGPRSPSYGSQNMQRAHSDGTIDPNSHAARRHRDRKLSQFFGETNIDFTNPPPRSAKGAASNGHKGKSKRRETLDQVLGEMWRNVQRDAQRGRMGDMEVRKLGDLISVLKRRSGGVWEEIEGRG